jgi:hypothetical protein
MVPKSHLDAAVRIAKSVAVPIDRLPYTPYFEGWVFPLFQASAGPSVTMHDCWWALQHARKSGRLKAEKRTRKPFAK